MLVPFYSLYQTCAFHSLNFIVIPLSLIQLMECGMVVNHAFNAILLLCLDIPKFLQHCLLAIHAVLLVLWLMHGVVMGFLGWIMGEAQQLCALSRLLT